MSMNATEVRTNGVLFLELKEASYCASVFGEFNKAWVTGIIENDLTFSHETSGEKFYATRVSAKRRSGVADYVPVVISEFQLNKLQGSSLKGKCVEVGGEFRSYLKQYEDGQKHLEKYLFVRAINIIEKNQDVDINVIYLEGILKKAPNFRITPFGREITELYLSVPRMHGGSDMVPCITWGKNALCASKFKPGNKIRIYGRIQSREYFKRVAPGSEEGKNMETHEISVWKIQKV